MVSLVRVARDVGIALAITAAVAFIVAYFTRWQIGLGVAFGVGILLALGAGIAERRKMRFPLRWVGFGPSALERAYSTAVRRTVIRKSMQDHLQIAWDTKKMTAPPAAHMGARSGDKSK